MTSQPVYYEDEIDIRKILEDLLNYKWWILGITAIFVMIAFLLVKLILPETYQSTAYIVITKPSLIANLDSRIQSSPQIPDARSLTDLTKADDLVLSVYEEISSPTSSSESVSLVSFKN